MPPMLTTTHPIFALPRERSRSYLNWGRRLAQAEAILLLFGACSLLDASAASGHINPFAIAAAGMAILWLILGHYVGRGSAHAAIILLGLSISRQAMAFMPGASEFWTALSPLILVDLFVFAQAARGAIALARPIIASPMETATVFRPRPAPALASTVSGREFKWPVDWVESSASERATPTSIWAPNFSVDFTVAASLVAVAMAWLNHAAGVNTEGVGGLAALFDYVCALFHLIVATVLFAAAYGGAKGKSWARGTRTFAYGALLLETLTLVRIFS
jgi:hypothetical protein